MHWAPLPALSIPSFSRTLFVLGCGVQVWWGPLPGSQPAASAACKGRNSQTVEFFLWHLERRLLMLLKPWVCTSTSPFKWKVSSREHRSPVGSFSHRQSSDLLFGGWWCSGIELDLLKVCLNSRAETWFLWSLVKGKRYEKQDTPSLEPHHFVHLETEPPYHQEPSKP